MLPPGAPPSWSSTGSIWRNWYVGPPAPWIAAIRSWKVCVADVTAEFVVPSLSWISWTPTMSGARRLFTISDASRANFAGVSFGERFSTLKLATVSSSAVGGRVTSRSRPPSTRVRALVSRSS